MSKHDDEVSPNLSDVIAGIEKTHGKGAIMKLGSKTFAPIAVIPTGSLALDAALGVAVFRAGA